MSTPTPTNSVSERKDTDRWRIVWGVLLINTGLVFHLWWARVGDPAEIETFVLAIMAIAAALLASVLYRAGRRLRADDPETGEDCGETEETS